MLEVEGRYLLSIVPEEVIREESDRMLQDTQTTLGFFAAILILCVVFSVLIWRIQKVIDAKDREVEYQAKLFDYLRSSDMENDAEATLAYYGKLNAMSPGESVAPRNTERADPKTGE